MRCVLLVLLAIPTSAFAQTEGAITADSTTINIAQCTGSANEVRGDADKMDVGLSWQVTLASSATFNTLGKYRVWASNLAPSVDPVDGKACENTKSSGTFYSKQVAEFDATSATMSDQRVDLDKVAAAAQDATFDCTTDNTKATTIYLCVQWVDEQNGSAANGWATGATMSLDLAAPTASPNNVNPQPGDGVLHVSCSNSDSASTSFKAKATLGTETPHWSSQGSSCSDLRISGLKNDQTYSVVVYGLDDANNPSPASDPPVNGTPVQTDDFWSHYKSDGGQDQGGCSTAAGAAGLLSALGLLALRRRKP